MAENQIAAYSISEIANWQTELQNDSKVSSETAISLPSLQRGFVWRPNQIENLWDSMLRGYPIGSLLMSKTDANKELLDGQQRSTSIALGHYDPLTNEIFNFFAYNTESRQNNNLKTIIPLVWIDLNPLKNNKNGLKYGVRVLTKSHPWGYQLSDNSKILSSKDRSSALEYFKERKKSDFESFIDVPNNIKTPWDAHYPIPLAVILSTDKLENIKKEVLSYCEMNLTGIQTKYSEGNAVNYNQIDDKIWSDIAKAAERAKKLLIPEILVNKDNLFEDEEIENENTSTLFVRLNSEGTRISGEELVYSLFKATFPKLKSAVENIGLEFIKPSKIINLLSRIVLTEESEYSFQADINLKRFRSQLTSPESNFEEKLTDFIAGNNNAHKLFSKAIYEIVTLNKEIPTIFYKDSILASLDVFYVLLIYLRKNEFLTSDEISFLHRSFIFISKFKSDDRKVSRKLFDALKEQEPIFSDWDEAVKSVISDHPDLLPNLLTPDNFDLFLKDTLLNDYLQSETTWFNNEDYLRKLISANRVKLSFLFRSEDDGSTSDDGDLEYERLNEAVNYWLSIANKFYWDKSFLIVAQSNYFIEEFNEYIQFESIVDTNKPWDWDHIYPHSWVYNKKGIAQKVRNIINLNGNFRALSFNENRSENNYLSPKERFESKIENQRNSFINENDLGFWLQLDHSAEKIQHQDSNYEKVLIEAVFNRISSIYKAFYGHFNINM